MWEKYDLCPPTHRHNYMTHLNLCCYRASLRNLVRRIDTSPEHRFLVPLLTRTSDRLACRSTIGRIPWLSTSRRYGPGSRDIVFLPRHELRNKITTRNWNYPRITIAPRGDRRLSVYWCVRKRKQCSANGLGARTGFRGLPRLPMARVSVPNVLYSTYRNSRARV